MKIEPHKKKLFSMLFNDIHLVKSEKGSSGILKAYTTETIDSTKTFAYAQCTRFF